MKRSAAVVYLTIVCVALGMLVMGQLRSTGRAASIALTSSDQAIVLVSLVESNSALRMEVEELQANLARLEAANREETSAALAAELNRLLVVSGDAEVTGPGVRVDVSGQINPLDMQDLINELRNSGAEAIAIDRQRVVVRSVVAREGADLTLDGQRLIPPYALEAIGNPDTIEKALLRRGGLVSLLEYAYPGLKVTVTVVDNLRLAAYRQRGGLKFAQPAPE
jgi:uncharacterized protein YlxW (UPF0749 family)